MVKDSVGQVGSSVPYQIQNSVGISESVCIFAQMISSSIPGVMGKVKELRGGRKERPSWETIWHFLIKLINISRYHGIQQLCWSYQGTQ